MLDSLTFDGSAVDAGPEQRGTTMTEENDPIGPNTSLATQVAVLASKFQDFSRTMEKRFDAVEKRLDDNNSRYSTKEDLEKVVREVDALKNQIGWAVKSVILIVITAVLGVVFTKAGGIPH